MWFIKYYLASTVIVLCITFIRARAISEVYKKKYGGSGGKTSLIRIVNSMLPSFLPFINIFFGIYFLFAFADIEKAADDLYNIQHEDNEESKIIF